MRLVVVTQQVDPASAVLGATVAKLRALAARVDELVVLADSAVDGALPGNCRVRLFRSRLRAGRGLRFETALARELARRPAPAAVLAHMCPIYAVLAAPLARPLGVDVLLWFTHWRRSRLLATAERLSTPFSASRSGRSRSPRASWSRSGTASTSPASRASSGPPRAAAPPRPRAHVPRQGPGDHRAGRRRGPRTCTIDVVGPSLTEEERRTVIALERLVLESARSTASASAGRFRATRCPSSSTRPTRS